MIVIVAKRKVSYFIKLSKISYLRAVSYEENSVGHISPMSALNIREDCIYSYQKHR